MQGDKFEKGDILICVIWTNTYLSKLQECECLGVSDESVRVADVDGDMNWYNKNRFIKKAEIRDIKINQILD